MNLCFEKFYKNNIEVIGWLSKLRFVSWNIAIFAKNQTLLVTMKNSSFFLTAVLSLSALMPLQADDLLNDVLVKYDFNTLICDCAANVPTPCSPCVLASDLTPNRLCQQLRFGSQDGSLFRNFSGWDNSYDYSFARTNFSSAPGTLSYDVFVKPDSIANISGVSFDWMRPDCTSVNAIQATIFWQGNGGGIEYLSSGPIALDGVGSWNSRVLDFPIDVNPLPTGIDTSGKQFHVELYAWGGGGGSLYLDNIALRGDCAPIPEPGGAILIAAAGLALLMRRRPVWS